MMKINKNIILPLLNIAFTALMSCEDEKANKSSNNPTALPSSSNKYNEAIHVKLISKSECTINNDRVAISDLKHLFNELSKGLKTIDSLVIEANSKTSFSEIEKIIKLGLAQKIKHYSFVTSVTDDSPQSLKSTFSTSMIEIKKSGGCTEEAITINLKENGSIYLNEGVLQDLIEKPGSHGEKPNLEDRLINYMAYLKKFSKTDKACCRLNIDPFLEYERFIGIVVLLSNKQINKVEIMNISGQKKSKIPIYPPVIHEMNVK